MAGRPHNCAMKPIASNKKARFEYTIVETIEAGISLEGTEVKSLREGRAILTDAYAYLEDGEIVLKGLHISAYSHTSQTKLDPHRDRKLLLHKSEIRWLIGKVREKGFTLVPLKLYFNARGIAKIELGLAKGKREYDKRRTIADREAQRDMQRALKDRSRDRD
jgi:SsrA-binding protein